MSRSKKLYILLGVFVVACIATLAVTQTAEHKEQIKNSGEPILELSSDSVQALSWEHKGETLYMEQAKDYRDLLQAVSSGSRCWGQRRQGAESPENHSNGRI